MQLVGSRQTGLADTFSDWDYRIESISDFEVVSAKLQAALAWRYYRKGTTHILTLIRDDFHLEDYNEVGTSAHDEAWAQLTATPANPDVSEYWILAFKHLKALYRNADLLLDVGLDLSTALLRDLFVEHHCGTRAYKDFFAFSSLNYNPGLFKELFAITGLPTRNRSERIEKLKAMNTLLTTLHPSPSTELNSGWNTRLAELP